MGGFLQFFVVVVGGVVGVGVGVGVGVVGGVGIGIGDAGGLGGTLAN